MKKIFFIVLTIISFHISDAQEAKTAEENITYSTGGIEVKPEYPGGIKAFYEYIASNFNSPTSKNFEGGKIYAQFVIEKDGSVVDIKILKDLGFNTAEETYRVLNGCKKWQPGEQNGRKVRCVYQLPISLKGYVFDVKEVDVAPNYEGGFANLLKNILENFNVPTSKDFKGGKVLISFVVETDGSISEFRIYKDLGFGTGDEAVRILQSTKKWIPAKKNNKNVRCEFGIPIALKGN